MSPHPDAIPFLSRVFAPTGVDASTMKTIGWLRTMTDGGQILGPLVMGFLADAVDLSTPFLFGTVLLMATAWQCRRQAGARSAAVTAGGQDS